MKNTTTKRIRKIVWISLLSLLVLTIVGGLTAYFLVHNYINKMHLISAGTVNNQAIEAEEVFSKEEELSVVEDQIEIFSYNVNQIIEDNNATVVSPDTIDQTLIIDEAAQEVSNVPDASEDEISKLNNQIKVNIESGTVMEDSKVTNILLIGSDTRISDDRGRSDSMIVITINKETKKIVATSFLRDIYLQIPGKENNRLNTAYAYGGADLLLETIERNFKFKIDKYIIVDFFAFIDIVDAIGGITMEVQESEQDTINSYIKEINKIQGEASNKDLLSETGTMILNGKQALGYARNRYSTNGDFDRTGRQREVLLAIYEKIKDQNLVEMNDFLNIMLPQITTNFTEKEIMSHILMLPTYFEYEMEEFNIPLRGTYSNHNIRGMEVLGIDFEDNINEIYDRLYNIN